MFITQGSGDFPIGRDKKGASTPKSIEKEVDFIAQYVNGKIELYQVCIDMDDAKTKQREISALIEAAMELKIDEAFIITTNTIETLQLDSIRIHILPYWQWALGIQS